MATNLIHNNHNYNYKILQTVMLYNQLLCYMSPVYKNLYDHI